MRTRIRVGHPDLKGSFIALGCEFNLFNVESMRTFEEWMARAGAKDVESMRKAKADAVKRAQTWEREMYLDFLYDAANKQGDWTVTF